MHATSREALAQATEFLDSEVSGDNAVMVGAQTGIELFELVSLLDDERTLRVAFADAATQPAERSAMAESLIGGKVSASTVAVVKNAVEHAWSTSRELRSGLVALGRRALLRSAEAQGQLETVEEELFELSRLLEANPELTSLLSDRASDSSAQRGLLASVLYGKVTMVTEALALQAVDRPEKNVIDDIAALSATAADVRGRSVARVTSAQELSDNQRSALAEKLGRIYGREMAIHAEVDPSLLGGVTIRVDDEVIDGSTRGKLARTRAALA